MGGNERAGMVDVTMLYAIKLGPMESEDGPISAYVGFTENGALPVLALKDSDGLAQLRSASAGQRAALRARHGARGQAARIRGGATAGLGALRASHFGVRSLGARARPQSRRGRTFSSQRGGLLSRRALALL